MKVEDTKVPVDLLVPVFLSLITGLPFALAASLVIFSPTPISKIVAVFFAPLIFAVSFGVVAGTLSLPFHRAIVPGKFPRSTKHPIYGARRLYGLCWGAIFYCTPVYYLFMSFPPLKRLLFGAFGYRGHSDVNVAPDAWIRDLPILNLGKGVYIANKSSIGTNMCLSDGSVLVDAVTLREMVMIGHMSRIAPGCVIDEHAEIAVDVTIGIRCQLGKKTKVGIGTFVNHGCLIGERVEILPQSYIGTKTKIADGIVLPPGINVPEGSEILSQDDVERAVANETTKLKDEFSRLTMSYAARARAGLERVGE